MLTPRQSHLLTYIRACQTERGFTPSVREMATHLGTHSMSTAYRLLEELEGRRFIRTTPGKSRSVVVLRTEIPTQREAELAGMLHEARLWIEAAGGVARDEMVARIAATLGARAC